MPAVGAVFYTRLGPGPASSVPAMEVAMAINALVALAAAGLTLLLPRRAAARPPAATEEPAAELSAGAAQQAKARSFVSFGRYSNQS
ncbi:MAG TPA: hypothetical protein VK594_11940 [Streptosporangiaceae bacterium]|nr:hypothetical protein [Streptosporangiaceae bacterium]